MPLQRYLFHTECVTRDQKQVRVGVTMRYAATSDRKDWLDQNLLKALKPIVEGQVRTLSLHELQTDLGAFRHINVGVESVARNWESEGRILIGPVTSFLSEIR